MSHKKWVLRSADKLLASELSEKFNIDPFISFLLVSRGMQNELAVSSFLSESLEAVSPFLFEDMEQAALTLAEAIDGGERICIYGDYDCDGVTSTALLLQYLREEGADAFYYIPSRDAEGYGLNKAAIDKIHARGAQLIVTVDNGISSVDEAAYIYSLGMRLVVTDHHQLGDTLPQAEAVVNPHRPENRLTFRDYCGVGVAFKLICALYDGDVQNLINRYVDLVAIGTIADVFPLLGENRFFVKAGLDLINRQPRPALEVFKNNGGKAEYAANDIAFQLCPRINAMGRMDDAAGAVAFLMAENYLEAEGLYATLCDKNAERQAFEKEILEDVLAQLQANPRLAAERVIVVSGLGYHPGVVGIVASHIVERYAKPAIVIGVYADGEARGSARSVEGFNIHDAIAACSEDLIRFGGHPLAAGVTLAAEKIDDFRKSINQYALRAYEVMPPATLTLDCKISPQYISLALAESLRALEPYGAMNPQAVFGVYKMKLLSVTPLSEGKHVRFECEKKGEKLRVVKFGTAYEAFPYHAGDLVDIAVKVSKNNYKERDYLSVQAVDIRLNGTDDDRYFREKNAYERYRLTGRADSSMYPSREKCAVVYRYLKANGGWPYDRDDLYFRLQEQVNYAQLLFALAAFQQAGLVSVGDGVTLLPSSQKVNLEETKILKTLRERLNIE